MSIKKYLILLFLPQQTIMTNLFTYGSLMFKEVIYALTTKKDYQSTKGTLLGYARRHVQNKVYPGIFKHEQSQVQGVVYFGLTNSDLSLLHQFERNQYIPTEVDIQTTQGIVKAIAYIYAQPSNLSEIQWNAQQFEQKYKDQFAKQHLSGAK